MSRQSPLIWRLVEDSMSEAAFLWLRLDAALNADDHRLQDVERWVEERLEGALDGVRVAGSSALDSLLPQAIEDEDLGAVAVAAYLTASLRHASATRLLEHALRQAKGARGAALACGLGRAANKELLYGLWARLAAEDGCAQATLLDALTFCAEAPPAELRASLESPEPELRRAAARALRFLPSSARDKLISRALGSSDAAVQTSACVASLAAGDAQAWSACLARAQKLDVESAELLPLVAALGSAREHARIEEALSVPALRQSALWALGFAGTPAAAEACLAQLEAGRDVREALAALTMITGLQLPAGSAAEDGDDVPVPDPQALRDWWQNQRARFEAGARYLDGERVTLPRLRAALVHGTTRRRHTLALELAVRSRGGFSLQPRAFCRQQREQLKQLESLEDRQLHSACRALGVSPLASP